MKCIRGCARKGPALFLALLLLRCGLLPLQSMAQAAVADGFLGRWDLTIRGADQKPLPSWLELKRDAGTWRAIFVGRWGNARPLPTVAIQGDQIRFVSPKQEEDSTNDLVFEGNLFNGTNFSGWTFDNPAKSSSWVVDKGCLVNQSAGSNIATERTFQDFKLHVEVNCPSNANSGI